ncbi:uncharacterized protein LOC116021755 [Ipomoea triloba]|uniref:uncharacterized protein LOC116021755 n=1 Tax=Ipomoea triloba TaxID=35885 RepID=UPI00125D9DFC|nr:uncharacterized protein LOC116021755 [Ipomoea triloba]
MKDEEAQIITSAGKKEQSSDGGHGFFGRGKYKLWVIVAILLLAFWSMFTGSLTLSLNRVSDSSGFPVHDDLDVLEVEEREKVVRQMWDVYTQSRSSRLPKFWQEAFEAAYEDMTSDSAAVRDAAVSEIAKMSLLSTATSESMSNQRETEAETERGHAINLGKKQ